MSIAIGNGIGTCLHSDRNGIRTGLHSDRVIGIASRLEKQQNL